MNEKKEIKKDIIPCFLVGTKDNACWWQACGHDGYLCKKHQDICEYKVVCSKHDKKL